jgi:sugar-specific transcriptional regulator TrmB
MTIAERVLLVSVSGGISFFLKVLAKLSFSAIILLLSDFSDNVFKILQIFKKMKLKLDRDLQIFLEEFGLTEREIRLYLSLLKSGPNTIMNLSRETGVKRSTTHNNVEELIKKGLVSQTNYGERRMVVAEDPEKLKFLLEQKRWDVKKLEEKLPDVVNIINEMIPEGKANSQVEIKYYTGVEGFKEVCDRSLNYAEGEILFITDLDDWYKVYTTEFDKGYYIPNRLKNNLGLKMLALETEESKKLVGKDDSLKREVRLISKNYDFKSTIIIYKNEVCIMISSEPYTAIVIQGKEIERTFTSLFYSMWEKSAE